MGSNPIAIYGWTQEPHMDLHIDDNPYMDIAAVIAYNLTALMESVPERDTLEKVAQAAQVGFGTVRRAKNGDGNLTVQKLEMIAQAFRRSARDLLIEPKTEYAQNEPCILRVAEPPPEERYLLDGYRDASSEVKEIMLDLARKATKKKDFEQRSERND